MERKLQDLIRARRRELSLTLQDVADRLGVSVAFVSDLEHGRRPVTRQRLPALLLALRVKKTEQAPYYQSAGFLPLEVEKRLLRYPDRWYSSPGGDHGRGGDPERSEGLV